MSQGMVFSPVPFQSEEPDQQETEQGGRRNGETEGFLSTLLGLKRIFYPNHVFSFLNYYAFLNFLIKFCKVCILTTEA